MGVENICTILVTDLIRLSMLQCLSTNVAGAGTAKDGRQFLHQTEFCNQTEFSPWLQNAGQRLPIVRSFSGINWQLPVTASASLIAWNN